MRKGKRMILVALIALLVLPSSVFAWTAMEKTIKVRFAQIQLFANYKKIETSAEPFIYNGAVYAPVATVANALGVAWQWDNHISAVNLFDRAHQLMEENFISGHLQVYPLGDEYYYYNDTGITYIHKGLKYQDKNSYPVTVPTMRKEGYTVSDHFEIPLREFIDMDRDGKKQELLVMYYLSPKDDAVMTTEHEIHVLKLLDERTFEDLGIVLKGKDAVKFHFDHGARLLFASYYRVDREENSSLDRIEVFQWEQDHVEAVDTFVRQTDPLPFERTP